MTFYIHIFSSLRLTRFQSNANTITGQLQIFFNYREECSSIRKGVPFHLFILRTFINCLTIYVDTIQFNDNVTWDYLEIESENVLKTKKC